MPSRKMGMQMAGMIFQTRSSRSAFYPSTILPPAQLSAKNLQIFYKVFPIEARKNPAKQDSPPAAGRFATNFIPAAVR
jgi:hypothetical protein